MKLSEVNLIQYRVLLENWLQEFYPDIWDYWETEASELLEIWEYVEREEYEVLDEYRKQFKFWHKELV